jgi:hypothetical protein
MPERLTLRVRAALASFASFYSEPFAKLGGYSAWPHRRDLRLGGASRGQLLFTAAGGLVLRCVFFTCVLFAG